VNPANDEIDITYFDQFCMILEKDPKLASQATKLLASKIQSSNPKEALLALEVGKQF
jgi:CRP-like cAMP-binding protein